MKNIINLIVEHNSNKKNKHISRSRIKNLILKKKLKINNKILIDPSKKVSVGEKIIEFKDYRD